MIVAPDHARGFMGCEILGPRREPLRERAAAVLDNRETSFSGLLF